MTPLPERTEKTHPAPRAGRGLTIALLLAAVFLFWVGLYLYVPTLPLYIQQKTSDLALVGITLSMYGLWQLISRLPVGILSDWIGRRKPLILGSMLVLAAGDWLLGSDANISGAVIGRALIGIAAGGWVPIAVMFSSQFDPDETIHAMAVLSMAGAFSRIVATSANGWLNNLGGFSLAFRLAALAGLLGAGTMLFLPDRARPRKKPVFRALLALGARRDILLPSIVQALLHTGDFAATFTFIPIIARLRGASDVTISLLLSLDMGISILGNLASRRLVPHVGPRAVSYLSISAMALGVGGAALAASIPAIFACQVLIGAGFGLGYPLFMGMSIDRVSASEQNTAMGYHQSIYSLGMFAGPWLSGVLAKALGIPLMFGLIAAVVFLCGVAVIRAFAGIPAASAPPGQAQALLDRDPD